MDPLLKWRFEKVLADQLFERLERAQAERDAKARRDRLGEGNLRMAATGKPSRFSVEGIQRRVL